MARVLQSHDNVSARGQEHTRRRTGRNDRHGRNNVHDRGLGFGHSKSYRGGQQKNTQGTSTPRYMQKILLWRAWYVGHVDGFHNYLQHINKRLIKRKRYGLKLARKVSKDWASILCNNKAQLVIDDEASNLWLQGDDEMGGILGGNDFWTQANQLVEKAFALGTAATDIYFEGLEMLGDVAIKNKDLKIKISYVVADSIIPLSWENGNIQEVAFASEVTMDGEKYTYVRLHLLTETGYQIINKYYKGDKDEPLTEAPLPKGSFPVSTQGVS